MDRIIQHIDYISNHGTAQGIWPRFYLQIEEMAKLAAFGNSFDSTEDYFNKVIPDLTNLYDLYNKIRTLITDYTKGVKESIYYKVNERGTYSLDRKLEIEIKNLVVDFITRSKILLVNFSSSGIVDDNDFKFNYLFHCKDDERASRKAKYIQGTDGTYLPIIQLIEKNNLLFINQLFEIRNSIEHRSFTLDKFELHIEGNTASVLEPMLGSKKLSETLEHFYESTLDFIERTLAYFFGLKGEKNLPHFLELHEDMEYSYPDMRYKFTFSLGGTPWSLTSKKCTYS